MDDTNMPAAAADETQKPTEESPAAPAPSTEAAA